MILVCTTKEKRLKIRNNDTKALSAFMEMNGDRIYTKKEQIFELYRALMYLELKRDQILLMQIQLDVAG